MYTIDKSTPITSELISKYIRLHKEKQLPRFAVLNDYYIGKHAILDRRKDRKLANNRIVCNHARKITDTATGYFIGEPVTYDGGDADITPLTDMLKAADAETQNMDLGKDCSVFGSSYEYVYMSSDEHPTPKLAVFDPRGAFIIYDDTVEHNELCGVFYYPTYGDTGKITGFIGTYCTSAELVGIRLDEGFKLVRTDTPQANPFGMVPMYEFQNDEEGIGDFEGVITLIDAYNTLQSDRVNDKEQFVNAILAIYGAVLGDSSTEKKETWEQINRNGVMEMDADARAEYLTRQLSESDVELLRKAIKEDIHQMSQIPNMSDENFSGNASGVAMSYKLLGFEQKTKIKERYFREGLKYRNKLFLRILGIKGGASIDESKIEIVFKRSLPSNLTELAQLVSTLDGVVPTETLLAQLPFVKDPKAAAEEMDKQKQESVQRQQQLFAASANTPPDGAEG